MKTMLHRKLLAGIVRAMLALFLCVQLTPGAFALCLNEGGIGIGCQCACNGVMTAAAVCPSACCASHKPVQQIGSGCASACELATAQSGACCEHFAVEYIARAVQPELPAPIMTVDASPAASDSANLLLRSADSVHPPVHAPPEQGSSPPALGVSPLPLRI
jgi:hypothetical protein